MHPPSIDFVCMCVCECAHGVSLCKNFYLCTNSWRGYIIAMICSTLPRMRDVWGCRYLVNHKCFWGVRNNNTINNELIRLLSTILSRILRSQWYKINHDNDKIPFSETETDKFLRKVKIQKMCMGVGRILHICILPNCSWHSAYNMTRCPSAGHWTPKQLLLLHCHCRNVHEWFSHQCVNVSVKEWMHKH